MNWAPRINPKKIRRLYESEAHGQLDEDILEDVMAALYLRCESIIDVFEARIEGIIKCPKCARKFSRNKKQDNEKMKCPNCGWIGSWKNYFRSFQHKQLSGAEPVVKAMRVYIQGYKAARTNRDKILLVDRLIHAHHFSQKRYPTRPVAVNLINGTMNEAIELLNSLAYGNDSEPRVIDERNAWKKRIEDSSKRFGV